MNSKFLVATFAEGETLLRAILPLRLEGLRVHDVYGPYPVHGIERAMGLRRSRLPFATLLFGFLGLTVAVLFQFYTNILDWPLNVGGKPANSALAFVPVSFELTVLFAGLGTVAAFLLRARLHPGRRERPVAPGLTDDVFALVLRQPEEESDLRRAHDMLVTLGAREIREGEEGPRP